MVSLPSDGFLSCSTVSQSVIGNNAGGLVKHSGEIYGINILFVNVFLLYFAKPANPRFLLLALRCYSVPPDCL